MQERNRRVALEVNAMTGTTDVDAYLAYFNDNPAWHINSEPHLCPAIVSVRLSTGSREPHSAGGDVRTTALTYGE